MLTRPASDSSWRNAAGRSVNKGYVETPVANHDALIVTAAAHSSRARVMVVEASGVFVGGAS